MVNSTFPNPRVGISRSALETDGRFHFPQNSKDHSSVLNSQVVVKSHVYVSYIKFHHNPLKKYTFKHAILL